MFENCNKNQNYLEGDCSKICTIKSLHAYKFPFKMMRNFFVSLKTIFLAMTEENIEDFYENIKDEKLIDIEKLDDEIVFYRD